MNPSQEFTSQLASLVFERAVLLLVEGDSFIAYQHLLEIIPFQHQLPFLELLQAGIPLRDCFAELDGFLAWKAVKIPLLMRQGILLLSVSQELTMYLLDKQFAFVSGFNDPDQWLPYPT